MSFSDRKQGKNEKDVHADDLRRMRQVLERLELDEEMDKFMKGFGLKVKPEKK